MQIWYNYFWIHLNRCSFSPKLSFLASQKLRNAKNPLEVVHSWAYLAIERIWFRVMVRIITSNRIFDFLINLTHIILSFPLQIGPLAGILGCIISLLGYGAASNYTQALLARSIPALLISGCPVAMKAMIGDACDEKGQAIALGVFNLGHGLGSVIGKNSCLQRICRKS